MAKFLFPIAQWFDNSGAPLAGGLISTYIAGTVTPQATWSESTGSSLNANPVVLDSAGRAQIWLSAAAYKFVIQTSGGATIMTIDGYNPDSLNTTVSGLTSTGDVTMQRSTAATSGANQSSNNLKVQGNYWDGSQSQIDQWNIQDILGTGANPSSTLTVTHSGSSGAVSVSIPSAPVSLGNTLSVTGATTQGTSETSPAFISSSANPASAGVVRLANTDAIKWRNNANGGDVALQKTGAASGNFPADVLDATAFGGVESAAFLSNTASPAAAGKVRLASADTIAWRNNAGANDVTIAKTGAVSGSVAADTLNLASFGGALLAGPIWGANSIAVDSTHPITIPASTDTMALLAASQALTNKTLNGAGSGNAVDLLNTQGPLSAIIGTGADATIYTYTIPANTIQAGKGISVRFLSIHSTGSAAVSYKIKLGSTTVVTASGTAVSGNGICFDFELFNAAGVQNSQFMHLIMTDGTSITVNNIFTSAENTANSLALTITFNVANTDQVTPKFFRVRLIQ